MPRIAVLNLWLGFSVVTIAACGGIFVAFDLTEEFLLGNVTLNSWFQVLSRSAHGHFNLFGFLHVLFGLTIPYSRLPLWFKRWQTLGLGLATLAMGPGMLWRASLGPTDSFDINGMAIGIGSGFGLLALASHAVGLAMKYFERGST